MLVTEEKLDESCQLKTGKSRSNFLYTCTCAIDVGTVFKRYLVGCLVERGKVMVVSVICDSEIGEDGRMTTENVKAAVEDTIAAVKELGVRVTAVVADNATNLQHIQKTAPAPAAEEDEDGADILPDTATADTTHAVHEAYEREPVLFVLRCAAHVIQLCVGSDCEKWWKPLAEEAMQNAKDAGIKITSHNDTRWNSRLRTLEEASTKLVGLVDETWLAKVRAAIALLTPFNIATQCVQGDAATILDSLSAFQLLWDTFASEDRVSPLVSNPEVFVKLKERIAFMVNGTGATPSMLVAGNSLCPRVLTRMLSSCIHLVTSSLEKKTVMTSDDRHHSVINDDI